MASEISGYTNALSASEIPYKDVSGVTHVIQRLTTAASSGRIVYWNWNTYSNVCRWLKMIDDGTHVSSYMENSTLRQQIEQLKLSVQRIKDSIDSSQLLRSTVQPLTISEAAWVSVLSSKWIYGIVNQDILNDVVSRCRHTVLCEGMMFTDISKRIAYLGSARLLKQLCTQLYISCLQPLCISRQIIDLGCLVGTTGGNNSKEISKMCFALQFQDISMDCSYSTNPIYSLQRTIASLLFETICEWCSKKKEQNTLDRIEGMLVSTISQSCASRRTLLQADVEILILVLLKFKYRLDEYDALKNLSSEDSRAISMMNRSTQVVIKLLCNGYCNTLQHPVCVPPSSLTKVHSVPIAEASVCHAESIGILYMTTLQNRLDNLDSASNSTSDSMETFEEMRDISTRMSTLIQKLMVVNYVKELPKQFQHQITYTQKKTNSMRQSFLNANLSAAEAINSYKCNYPRDFQSSIIAVLHRIISKKRVLSQSSKGSTIPPDDATSRMFENFIQSFA